MYVVRNRWISPGPHNGDDIVEFDNQYFSWVTTNTTTQTAPEVLYDDVQLIDPEMWNVVNKYAPDILGQHVIGTSNIPPHINPFNPAFVNNEEEQLEFDLNEVECEVMAEEKDNVANNNGRSSCYKCNMRTKEIGGLFSNYNICGNSECEWYEN